MSIFTRYTQFIDKYIRDGSVYISSTSYRPCENGWRGKIEFKMGKLDVIISRSGETKEEVKELLERAVCNMIICEYKK